MHILLLFLYKLLKIQYKRLLLCLSKVSWCLETLPKYSSFYYTLQQDWIFPELLFDCLFDLPLEIIFAFSTEKAHFKNSHYSVSNFVKKYFNLMLCIAENDWEREAGTFFFFWVYISLNHHRMMEKFGLEGGPKKNHSVPVPCHG